MPTPTLSTALSRETRCTRNIPTQRLFDNIRMKEILADEIFPKFTTSVLFSNAGGCSKVTEETSLHVDDAHSDGWKQPSFLMGNVLAADKA